MIELKDSPYWKNYRLGLNEPGEPMAAFAAHAEICGTWLASVPESKADFRYAPDKWSVKQVVGHVTDANLIFLYRILSIGRGETQSLPGFDENIYAANASFDSMSWRQVLEGHRAVTQAAGAIIAGFDGTAWARSGCANDVRLTPKDMLWVLMGHERHHIGTLKERYDIA